MNKYLVLVIVLLGLTACTLKDEHYYQTHPKELQQAMKACPTVQPKGLTCEQITDIAARLNTLAYQLQYNPQGFGSKILAMQQTIANQESELSKDRSNKALQSELAKNQHELADHMAVVKWLESPES